MFTKQHFEVAVLMVAKSNSSKETRKSLYLMYVDQFTRANPRFDLARFNRACGILNPAK
jgi:hypothetical protein